MENQQQTQAVYLAEKHSTEKRIRKRKAAS
jgi:hypothetical protein